MRSLLVMSLTLLTACSTKKPELDKKADACLATREYVTTIEYLREQKYFSLNEEQMRTLANRVSAGCTGASNRFIKITNLLVKSGLPSQKAIDVGLKYGLSDDESFAAFITIFKSSYLESLLDLDLERSVEIANNLTTSFEGNKGLLEKEFNKLVKFCVEKKSLDLPLPACATLASEILKSGEKYNFNIGNEFIDTFQYLISPKKANLPTFRAIKVAKDVIKFGPKAKQNFISGYEYGVSNKGLALTINDAIEFGKTMASRSVIEEKKEN